MESGDIILVIFALGLFAAGFAGQMHLCLKSDSLISKLLPAIILLGIELICIIIIFATGADSEPAEGISLTALAQMVICAVILVPVEIAWIVYGIKCLIEKKKNKKVFGENT